MSTKGRALRTPHFQWELLRDPAAVDGAALLTFGSGNTVSGYSYSDVKGSVFDLQDKFGNDYGQADICLFALKNDPNTFTPAANQTFGFQLWGWRQGPAGPGFLMCQAATDACILGTMTVPYHPTTGDAITAGALWCDTITVTNYWSETCAVHDSGVDRIALIKTNDLHGMRYLKLMVYGASINNVGAVISVY